MAPTTTSQDRLIPKWYQAGMKREPPAKATKEMKMDTGQKEASDVDFPVYNKDSFKCFQGQDVIYPVAKNNVQRGSIYSTLPDGPLEQKIVNEPTPQITLKYLTIRGKQYSLQRERAQKAANSAKKLKIAHHAR